MKKLVICLLLSFPGWSGLAQAQLVTEDQKLANKKRSIEQILILAKAHGMCETFVNLINHEKQVGLQFPGARRFILSFMEEEARRWKKSIPNLTRACSDTRDEYEQILKLYTE